MSDFELTSLDFTHSMHNYTLQQYIIKRSDLIQCNACLNEILKGPFPYMQHTCPGTCIVCKCTRHWSDTIVLIMYM